MRRRDGASQLRRIFSPQGIAQPAEPTEIITRHGRLLVGTAMNAQRLALATVFALSAAACADRAKQVNTAETNLTREQQQAREDQARLDQEQAREQANAQQKPMTTDERAELQTKQIDEQAETRAEGQEDVAGAKEDLQKAMAGLASERTKLEADAKERLVKADAKVIEAKNKSAKVPANKRAKFNAALTTFNTKKADVVTSLSKLGQASDADWDPAKTKLNKNLDALEKAAERLDDECDAQRVRVSINVRPRGHADGLVGGGVTGLVCAASFRNKALHAHRNRRRGRAACGARARRPRRQARHYDGVAPDEHDAFDGHVSRKSSLEERSELVLEPEGAGGRDAIAEVPRVPRPPRARFEAHVAEVDGDLDHDGRRGGRLRWTQFSDSRPRRWLPRA